MVPLLLLSLGCPPAITSANGPSQLDGGAADGGALDGGALDGGTLDGGAPDGGTKDGGSTDGGSTDGGSADGGAEVGELTLSLDDDVVTMVDASWDPLDGKDAWVEYRFEGDDWLVAPALGPGDAVILGVPSETAVEARLVVDAGVDSGGEATHGSSASITTGSLPHDLPLPEIDAWDADLADPAGWAMISVAAGSYTYQPPYWIEIFDRQGRVVWYHEVSDYMFAFYPTVSLDGTHIWYEKENIFGWGSATPSITRRTLDGRWSTQVTVPGMGQAAGEGPDGSFFFELRSSSGYGLSQVDADGAISQVWDCAQWMSDHGRSAYYCYMNTTNYSESHGTVLASMFEANTVFEIDLATQEPIRQFGQLTVGDPWTFSPEESVFDYQHNVYWLDEDTLLASTHIEGVHGVQVAAEYDIDDATQTLTRGWQYVSTDKWATQTGEAIRLPNGNTVQNYGQDGALREVTPDLDIAWQVSWDKDSSGYRVIGHLSLVEDLYALNRGPE